MLGMSERSQTVQNLLREKECVLNLPSENMVSAVDKLALYTGRNPVPESKAGRGYRYEPDKLGIAGLTPQPSDLVKTPRIRECPVQLEAKLIQVHSFEEPSSIMAIEVKIDRVHISEDLLMDGEIDYVDPEKWKPLMMNFCEYFGLGGKLHASRLATIFAPTGSQSAANAPS
jgi:flavin reductase (DIM6/NTAB) family NADH-FMN oxidoreductase RutF